MVFQSGALFDSLTVGENVAFPLRELGGVNDAQIDENVDFMLDMVGIRAERDRLPAEISIRMRRSVAIARAIAEKPEAVLYDEPTTMVDPMMGSPCSRIALISSFVTSFPPQLCRLSHYASAHSL